MHIPTSKPVTVSLGIAVALLLAASAKLSWDLVMLSVRIEFAREQLHIFDEMRRRALDSNVADAVELLRYAHGYYPSGTKQLRGSKLDRIVERQRAEAVRAIISHLRSKTREDLGETPE